MNIPDHPDIQNIERTGYAKPEVYPICPICGEECEQIFTDRFGRHVGCDACIRSRDAWEVDDCFPGKEQI